MLSRYYDEVYVGKNLLTYLRGLCSLNKRKSVLIIDDPSYSYGTNWLGHVGSLEVALLKKSFAQLSLNHLNESLNSCLELVDLELHLNNVRVRLAGTPYDHLFELCRKLPMIFDENVLKILQTLDAPSFNDQCYHFFENIGEGFNFEQSGLFKKKLNQVLPELVDIFSQVKDKLLEKNFNDDQSDELRRHFLYVLQGSYQRVLSRYYFETELDFLLLQLLCRRYHIKSSLLHRELHQTFLARGGHGKEATIQQWQVHQGAVDNILLSTYEGVISPGHTYFMGAKSDEYPFRIGEKKLVYRSLKLSLDLPATDQSFMSHRNTDIFVTQKDSVATKTPIIHIVFPGHSRAQIHVAHGDGNSKLSEKKLKQIKKSVARFFHQIFPKLSEEQLLVLLKVEPGDYVWVEKTDLHKPAVFKTNRSPLHFDSAQIYQSDNGKKLKKVSYVGALDARPFGLLSYLT